MTEKKRIETPLIRKGRNNMKKLTHLILALTFVIGLSSNECLAKTTWNANSVWPPNNHQTMALDEFAAKMKEITGGELEIVVSSGGALGYKGPELLKVVRDGLVPLSDMLISGVAGEEKIFQIVTLPFLALNFEEARLLNDTARPYFDKTAEKWGQKILYISPWPGAGLWTKRKVVSVADMKGLKTRTYDKNGALVVEAAGGTPYALPFSEVYSSLATGVIDSVITSTPTAVDAKFWEVLKYYQPLNITIATNMVNVNLKAFNKLDKKTQDALVKAGREMEESMWKKVAILDKEKEDLCTKNGMETVPASKEFMKELNAITEMIRADWLKDATPDAKAMYHEFLKKVQR
jgi:TRAP-type C4-dicarboxylate transport system substrate-binding protein